MGKGREARRGEARRSAAEVAAHRGRTAEQPDSSVSPDSYFTIIWVRDVFKCSSPASLTQVQIRPRDGTARGEGERDGVVITYIWLRTQEI